jgi:hypothetical protein
MLSPIEDFVRMTVDKINLPMSTHPQMKRTIPTLNVGTIKLDELFRIFGDDFLNNEITIIGEHNPDTIRIEIIKIGKPRIGENWGRFGLSNE